MIAYPYAEKNLLLIQIKNLYKIKIFTSWMAKCRATWRKQMWKKFFNYQLLERHPFSGRCDSAGELLHTPCADSNFHGDRPAVSSTRNTLSVYRKVGADKVKPGLS